MIGVTSQRSDIHLFGLLAQFVFVMEHGLDDEIVATDDDDNWQDVQKNGRGKNVGFVVLRRG